MIFRRVKICDASIAHVAHGAQRTGNTMYIEKSIKEHLKEAQHVDAEGKSSALGTDALDSQRNTNAPVPHKGNGNMNYHDQRIDVHCPKITKKC